MKMKRGSRDYDQWLDVPETAAILRKELKVAFPAVKCTVKVEHRWYGWLRVRAFGADDPALQRFLDQFCLVRVDGMTDQHDHYINTVQIDGRPVRIVNDVTSINIEWVPTV